MLKKIQKIIEGATTYKTTRLDSSEFKNSPNYGEEVTQLPNPLMIEATRWDYTPAQLFVVVGEQGDAVLYRANKQGKYYEFVRAVFRDWYDRETDFITAVIIAVDRYLQDATR